MHTELDAEGIVVMSGKRVLLHEACLQARGGELVAVVGRSGAGKSTLARALVGLVRARPGVCAGRVTVRSVRTVTWAAGMPTSVLHGAGLAWIGQQPWAALPPFWTVGSALVRAGAAEPGALLAAVGLPPEAAALSPASLSGGMARRAGVALALAGDPGFVVLDEPTAGLDAPAADAMVQMLADLGRQGAGVLLFGHDIRLLRRHATRLVVLDQGRVVEVQEHAAPLASAAGRQLEAAAQGAPWNP